MKTFAKAILHIGRYETPAGTLVVSAPRLRHWTRQFRAMRARGIRIPVALDHAPIAAESQPRESYAAAHSAHGRCSRIIALPCAERAVGWVRDLQVARNGRRLQLVLELRDPRAAQLAAADLVQVSPVIFRTWRDGRGRLYRDCITHVDFVLFPVDISQSPFVAVD